MNDLEHINFDKAWWDTASIDGISIGDKVFYAIGDSSLNGKKATWVVLFNKMLTANAGVPDLYSLVKEGKWTLDKLQEYGKQIAQDTDGDGAMAWGTDVFGVGLQYEVVIPLLLGDGKKLLEVNDDGSLVYNLAFNSTTDVQGFLQNIVKAETFTYASKEAANKKVVTKNMENLLKKINEK